MFTDWSPFPEKIECGLLIITGKFWWQRLKSQLNLQAEEAARGKLEAKLPGQVNNSLQY